MKLIKYLILPIVILLFISSCYPTESTTAEIKYLKQFEQVDNFYAIHESDIKLLELGNLVCDSFDAGMTGDEVVQQITNTGVYDTDTKIEFVGIVIMSAMNELCPQYLNEVR